jgi:hypothetical protein
LASVIAFLRFLGILNAAVWCGSAIFMVAGLPAIFSDKLKTLLTVQGVGLAAEALVARFFVVQCVCGLIALGHLTAEWLYAGRPARRFNIILATALLWVGLIGSFWVQPKMEELHRIKYFGRSLAEREEAGKTFAVWHGISESVNLLVICGLVVYLWRVSSPDEPPRFGNFNKIRG